MHLIPQRAHFNGPELLSLVWTLTKGFASAACEVWSHQFGFELRLCIGGEFMRSSVCRTQEKLIEEQER